MSAVTTVVVGAGHSGLAMSRHLAARSIDHVVLERGEVANSWRTQRWDSLRLLTPNWMTRLPGLGLPGRRPGRVPVGPAGRRLRHRVRRRLGRAGGHRHDGDRGAAGRSGLRGGDRPRHAGTRARWCWRRGRPAAVVPPVARHLPDGIVSVPALRYRNPDQLPDGGVLVVGASASGVQIADELAALRSRRSRSPSASTSGCRGSYRGHDILWWLDAIGVLDERWDEVDDLVRARNLPSLAARRRRPHPRPQRASRRPACAWSAGSPAVRDGVAQFSGSLANVCALADLKLGRLLDTIDEHAGGRGERPEPTHVPRAPLGIDLRSGEIRSVVWATGVRPDFSWLDVPGLDHRGRLLHDGGVTRWPGPVRDGPADAAAPPLDVHRRSPRRRRATSPRICRPPRAATRPLTREAS